MFKSRHTKQLTLLTAAALVLTVAATMSFLKASAGRKTAVLRQNRIEQLEARAGAPTVSEEQTGVRTENFLAWIERAVNESGAGSNVLSIRNIGKDTQDTDSPGTLEITLAFERLDGLMPLLERIGPVPAQKLDISQTGSGSINIVLQITQTAQPE